jgi:ribonuclease R
MERRYPRISADAREDTREVMKLFKIQGKFPASVIKDAERSEKRLLKRYKREDLRKMFIFTCDPATARDFDDALSLTIDEAGNRVLGVHIADVSHYVLPDSAMDKEAFKRGNSVYFPDRVVPMLPETVSNGVCSLVPGKERLAFSVFITYDEKGVPIARRFVKSRIKSKVRFTYEEVGQIIAGSSAKAPKEAVKAVLGITALAKQLRQRRFSLGALDIEIPEMELHLDENGEMLGCETRSYDESHWMVEECMVAANEAVATELWTKGIRIPARLHEQPDEEKIEILQAELNGMGVKTGDLRNRKVFINFLKRIKNHPLYSVIGTLVLRSMKRAVYDGTEIGHFGLAKQYYAHFTSPIRRYADLVLHRQLAEYLAGGNPRIQPYKLAKITAQVTEREEISVEAERMLAEIKKMRFLHAGMTRGEIYTGVISKCMPFGCFVEIPEFGVSGLIHVSMLSNSYVEFDEVNQLLFVPSGKKWRIGDRIDVSVADVDVKRCKAEFVPAERKGRSKRWI